MNGKRARQAGYSLVELMVAMGLGVLLSTVAVQVYIENLRTFRQSEEYGRMQENARYALYVLAQDLKMAGFFGQATNSPAKSTTNPPSTPANDCGAGGGEWTFDTSPAVQFVGPTDGGTAVGVFGCLDSGSFPSNGSALGIKRVDGKWTSYTSVGAGVYVVIAGGTDTTTGNKITGTEGSIEKDPTGSANNDYWKYVARVYSIRNYSEKTGNGVPSLIRQSLSDDGASIAGVSDEEVLQVEGIETFVVNWGIDTDQDGVADYYTASPDFTVDYPVSARIHLLVRAASADYSHTNTKTYQLGGSTLGPFNDNYRRRVYSTTVRINNLVNRQGLTM